MATEVVKVIDPNSGAGYDYASLFDWEAAQQGDLTGARNEIAIAKCRCTGGTADTTACTVDGWTTSATQYIKIWTDPADGYRHNGTYETGNHYRLEVTLAASGGGLFIEENYTKVYGLQFKLNSAEVVYAHAVLIGIAVATTTEVILANSIFKRGTVNANVQFAYGVWSANGAGVTVYNSIFYDYNVGTQVACGVDHEGTNGYCRAYNCTFVDCNTGLYVKEGTPLDVIAINCLFKGNSTDVSALVTSTTYSATDRATLDGTGNRVSQTFTFVNEAGDNFHLTSDDGGARDFGNGATPKALFTDDIDGDSRPATDLDWDIGADEYVSGAGIDQEGFRFRNDDGTEANATWAADQDANITAPLDTNLRLRMIRNANGDPGTAPFRIEYSGDGNNFAIVTVGNIASNNVFTANNTWTCPAGVNSALVECWGAGGAGSGRAGNNGAGGGGGGSAFASNNCTVIAGTNYTVQVGPEVAGNTGTGAHGGNSFFSIASNNLALCLSEGGNGGNNGTSANGSVGAGGAGGTIANCVGNNAFAGGAGFTGSNTTIGGSGGGGAGTNGNGNNASNTAGGQGGNALGGAGGTGGNNVAGNTGVTYGGGGAGAKRRGGSLAGGNGAAGYVRVTYTPVPPILLSISTNIAAGGNTNTTGQLTAPANKNANNFEAGRISDDTNPLATIDMGANSYSEDEWCLKAQAPAANNNVYYFRVTSNGTAFNSYNAVPQWTIGIVANNNKTVNLTDSGGGADGIGALSVMASMSDNGIGADATPIGALIPTQSDAGTGADVLASLLASMGISDAGAGTDLISSILISLGITDSGAGVDTIAGALASLALTDAGAASDVIQAFFLLSLLDSATGTDLVNAIAASIGIPDTGAGADALSSVGVALGLSDTASGADIISAVMASLSISDIGTAIDVIQAFFLVALYDSGVGADEINTLANSFGLTDTGVGADIISVLGGSIVSISDTATAQDVISSLFASLTIPDTGTGVDTAQQLILISTTDSATGVDSVYQVLVQSTVVDTGAGVETPSVRVVLAVSDSVSGLDSPTVLATINLSDAGAGIELIDVIKQAIISILDAGIGADQISSIQVFVPVSDAGSGVDILPLLQAVLSVVDLGTGVDVAINLTLLGTFNRLLVTFSGKKSGLGFAPKKGSVKITPKKGGTEFIN